MQRVIFLVIGLVVPLLTGMAYAADLAVPLESRDRIFAVHFCDTERGWIVGDKGLIACTVDRGRTWARKAPVTDVGLCNITVRGKDGWAVGHRGTIVHSGDAGRQWEKQESGCEASLFDVAFLDSRRGVAIGDESTILNTQDGGATWERNAFDSMSIISASLIEQGITSVNFYDLCFLDERHGWIVGEHGTVLFSADGGAQWQLVQMGNYPTLFSVCFMDAHRGFAAGQGGLLLSTEDGGQKWETIETHTEANLYKVCMNDACGLAVGDNGVALASSDGGTTWAVLMTHFPPPAPWLIGASLLGRNSAQELAVIAGQNMITMITLE